MKSPAFSQTGSLYQFAAWSAISSGIVGIIAFSALIAAVNVRNSEGMEGAATALFRAHDVGAIIQLVLMIPVVFALYKLSKQRFAGTSRRLPDACLASLLFTVLLLLLAFPKIVADPLYMLPQGLFGVCIILACWYMPGLLSRGLRWFGIVVGFGLALVGLFPLGYAVFVDTIILQIPAASDAAVEKIPSNTPANMILHYILFIGTFMGIITLPVWTILIGRRLLRENNS